MRVGLFGAFGIGNLGNDASARAMIALLRSADPSVQIAALSRGRAPEELLGIPVVGFTGSGGGGRLLGKLGDLGRLLRIVKRFDVVVVPGTGLLEEPRRRLPGGDLTWLLSVTLACVVRRVPVAWFSLGGAREMTVVPRVLTAAAARAAGYASFRDRMTAKSLGRGAERRVVVPDVVFAHPVPSPSARVDGAPVVAVAVLDYDPGDDATRQRYFAELGSALDAWVGNGWVPRFVVGDAADVPHADTVRAALAARHPDAEVSAVAPLGDLDALVAELGESDVVVASRYHVLLAAALAGRPMVALSHADKDAALMTGLGLPGLLLPAATFSAAELVARGQDALGDAGRIRRSLAERVHDCGAVVASEFRRSGIATKEGLRR